MANNFLSVMFESTTTRGGEFGTFSTLHFKIGPPTFGIDGAVRSCPGLMPCPHANLRHGKRQLAVKDHHAAGMQRFLDGCGRAFARAAAHSVTVQAEAFLLLSRRFFSRSYSRSLYRSIVRRQDITFEDKDQALRDDIADLRTQGKEVIVVSSGAIALGRNVLKLPKGPLKLEDSQAAAAVGQIHLAHAYEEAFRNLFDTLDEVEQIAEVYGHEHVGGGTLADLIREAVALVGQLPGRPRFHDGAVEKTRTSTAFRPQRPQRCASTSSATTAHRNRRRAAGDPAPTMGNWKSTAIVGAGSWDGDGHADVLAVERRG